MERGRIVKFDAACWLLGVHVDVELVVVVVVVGVAVVGAPPVPLIIG